METILSPSSFCPLFNPKISTLQSRPTSLILTKSSSTICSCLKRQPSKLSVSDKQPFSSPRHWFSHVQQGLAALALSIALSYCPILPTHSAFASEFDVLNDGPPKESYVVDDAGVLSRVTKSDLKRLLSDLESRKGYHINVITVRKLTSKADAFEYADQVLERWYPTVEEGNNKGIVVLITSQKEGAITGGPEFVQAVGDTVLDATVSENLPGIANTKSWFQFYGDGFAIRVPPQFEDILEPEDYNAGLSLYGDKAKPKTFAARFASPDGSEVLSVVIRPSNQLKITFLEAKDITDLGSIKETAKIFVPAGGATLYSARTIKIKEDEGLRTYYFYEFGRDEQHVALVAAVNSGKAIIAGATAPQYKWNDDGVKLRSAAISLTVL